MTFEYKTVGAPEKGKRKRGARSPSDRVAAAFEEILQAEAVDGWEYLRTDLLPVIERAGWFGQGHEAHRAVMVFRRKIEATPAARAQHEPDDDPVLQLASKSTLRSVPPEPEVRADPDLRIADMVRGPENRKPSE